MRTILRQMTPADVPAVLERLREQNERDGTSYAVTPVFDDNGARMPNVPLALVAVDGDTGIVVQAHIFERTVEMMSFGIDPEATVCTMHEQQAIAFLLRERGYRDLHVFVTKDVAPQMEHGLSSIAGFSNTEGAVKHFYRLLDNSDNDALREWYAESRDVGVK